MDLASGTRKLLAPDSLHVTSFDWSADSQFIAYTAYPEPPSGGYDWLVNATIGGVFITGTGGEEPRLLAPLAPAISDFVRFSSDGRWLSYNTGTGIFVCTTNPAEGIKPKQVVDAASIPSWTRVFWSTDSDSLFLQTRGELTQSVELVRMRGLIREPVLKGGQFYREFAVSANSRIFVATVEGVSDPAQIIVGTLPSGTIRTLVGDDMLNPHLAKLIRPSAERIVWRSKDNKWDIQGILIKPPGWQPNQRYPLLVGIMGGPSPVNMEFDVGDAYFSPILFASHGYFVLYPMTRGRAGAGRGFAHAINDEQSELENPLQDALRGEEVLVEQGLADSRRLAVMGGSYGGRLVAYATTRTDRFRAAINWEGIRLNLLGQLFDGWGNAMARRYLTDLPISAAANPYDAVGRTQLELLSPIYHAQNIKTPTLCLYGINSLATKDGRPWFQALQYFGIPSELIVYPRTGHGIREAVLMRDSYTRELAWFDYWLKDERYPNTEAQQEYDAWRRHMIKTNDPRWISSHPSG
jgi:dipeptidyl aminopeptidase/acylaminoacyl peptidase